MLGSIEKGEMRMNWKKLEDELSKLGYSPRQVFQIIAAAAASLEARK